MALTHILVDFDNKQPTIQEVARLSGASQRLWIFSSPNSGKFKGPYVQALLAHEGRAQLIHCTKAGNNAVDLHIALHIGRLIADRGTVSVASRDDDFVVVSGDKDFVPLLEYVRTLGYRTRQVKSLKDAFASPQAPQKDKATKSTAKVESSKPNSAETLVKQPLGALMDSLRKSPKNRPATVSSLGKWLVAHQVPAAEVGKVTEQLASASVLRVDGKKVVYQPEPWPLKR